MKLDYKDAEAIRLYGNLMRKRSTSVMAGPVSLDDGRALICLRGDEGQTVFWNFKLPWSVVRYVGGLR